MSRPRAVLGQAVRKAAAPALARLDRRTDALQQQVDELRQTVAKLSADLDAARPALAAVDLLLGPVGRGRARRPDEEELKRLQEQITAVTGERDSHTHVVIAYRMLVELELRGLGRIAGGASNILGKLVTVPLLAPPSAEILEIGTLYGLFSAGLFRQLLRTGAEPHVTILDPAAGVQWQYAQPLPGDPSRASAGEAVIRGNLALGGLRESDYRLHVGFSTDPQARDAVSDRQYGVIIVDGDHSREGVAQDLVWVEAIAAPGALVVMDDYGDRGWPGVKEALDAHLREQPTRLELVGTVATSAFLRAR